MRTEHEELLFGSQSVSEFLRRVYLRRLDKNSNYSIRAFARDLNMSPSSISEGWSSDRGMSGKSLEKISQRLKLNRKARGHLLDLSLATQHKNVGVRREADLRLKERNKESEVKKLDLEKFKVISEWFHAAIMELAVLPDFQSNTQWIATRLNITEAQASMAMERLLMLEMMEVKNGRWVPSGKEMMSTSSPTPSSAIRQYHRQMIEKSLKSLFEDAPEVRDLNSMIMAVPAEKIGEFRDQFRVFFHQFWEKMEPTEKNEVYALNMQFIPLTKGKLK